MRIKRRVKEIPAIEEAIENFLLEKEATGRSPKTLDNYRYSLNQLSPAKSFSEISETWIYDFMLEKKKEVSIESVNHYLRDIRSFLYWCMDKEYLPRFKINLMKGQETQPKFYSEEDIRKLIKKNKDESFVEARSRMICVWVLGTGNRASSIVNVKVEDINFKTREIALRATKNKKAQNIPLSSKLSKELKAYLKDWEVDEWLFPTRDGYQLTVNALKHAMARHAEARGVDKTSIHGLRHTFAREWVRSGGDVFKLQQILGHSTLDMTRRYVKLYSADLQDGFVSPLDKI